MTSAVRAPGRVPFRSVGLILPFTGVLLSLCVTAAGAHAGHGVVEILEVDGVVDRPVAGYLTGAVAEANASAHVEALVLQLDSPGALKADIDGIVAAIRGSRVPVVAWIPPGGQAVGGAFQIASAAHLLGVAPGARLGPDQPTDMAAGEPEGEGLLVLPDGTQPADLPEAVRAEGRTVLTESEAVEEGAAAFSAPTLPDVLRELDQRVVEVDLLGRQTLDVDPVSADVRFQNMGLGRRVLHAVASPALAYLLIVAGALALAFEVFQPGFGVSGISGLVLLGLGAYALTVLPVSPLGVALLVLGLALLAVDLSIAGFGWLTAGGTGALAAGSLLLFDGPPALRVSPWLVALVVLSTVSFFVIVMTVVLRAQAGQAQEGADQVVGKRAVVRSMLNPEGHVFVDGALWRARAPQDAGKVRNGTVVRIVGLDDRLTLEVELEEHAAAANDEARATRAPGG